MKKLSIKNMTLRQKIGQTGMPGPNALLNGIIRCGGFEKYFQKYPFAGLYICTNMLDHQREIITETREKLVEVLQKTQEACEIPLLVTCDAEFGAQGIVKEMHQIPSNMSVGAASDKELTYLRSYYYAKELKSCGINWAFSPVLDLAPCFFNMGVRTMGDNPDVVVKVLPDMLKGYQDAGVATTAKHFPSGKGDYRDAHIATTVNRLTREEWDRYYLEIYRTAVEAGVDSVMLSHAAFPAVDPSFGRGAVPRPASASKKVIDILRKELQFDGVILTDAVSMRGYTSAFEHAEGYIEGFNAGNDLILFCHDDYIDIMEQAVLDGKVSMERLDESVERILRMKERVGLFADRGPIVALTEEENKGFDQANYDLAKKAITLINNVNDVVPFDAGKVKKVAVVYLAEEKGFEKYLQKMVQAFEDRGVQATLFDGIQSKAQMQELSETMDIIICACLFDGIRCTVPEIRSSLIHLSSYGAEKTVVASFGTPTNYYNYFESVDVYLNAYSQDEGTMRAFVDGLLGDFAFTGTSPVELMPRFDW